MRGPKAVAVEVSPLQRSLLERLQRRHTADQRLVRRASVILTLADDPCVPSAARRLGLNRLSVRLWRDRWLDAASRLRQAEQAQADEGQLAALLEEALGDAPRPGAPPTFSPEQVVQIVALACEPPGKSNRPISHWTSRELADEAQKRPIVPAISARSVGRFLKRGRPAAAPQPLLAQR